MRKLATIQRVINIEPIPDADKIEKCTVLGWNVVIAKRDGIKVGDLVCYIEIDSIVPAVPMFEFLKDRKYRVRTIKLRKQISQGLVIPLNLLPLYSYQVGDDVTDILGIKKYDPQADLEQALIEESVSKSKNKILKFFARYPWYRRLFMTNKSKHGFPTFIKKTDEERIQNMPQLCGRDFNLEITEKIDGQSATYFLVKEKHNRLYTMLFGNKYTFGVCSRNLYLPKENDTSYWKIAKKYNIEDCLRKLINNNDFIVLQGEIIGTNIQGNKYKVTDYDFYAYNLIYEDYKLNGMNAKQTLNIFDIKFVPIILVSYPMFKTVDIAIQQSIGPSMLSDKTQREGIVCRNYDKNISFKVINPEFLLKNEE